MLIHAILMLLIHLLCSYLPSSNFFCRAGFKDRYCLNQNLSSNISFSPSMVFEGFAGYSSLGWHLWFFRGCKISIQTLLAFRISVGKYDVILIYLPLYVTWNFYLAAFTILSLFCRFCVWIVTCQEDFFFWFNLIGVLQAS